MADENVQGATSEGAASTEGNPQTPAPAFTKEQEEAIAKRIAESVESVGRKFQSEKDRAIAKAQREANEARRREAEARNLVGVYAKGVGELDPDAATKLRLATYEERERFDAAQRQAEEAERARVEFHDRFTSGLANTLTAMGLDPKDPSIDWADSTDDYLEKHDRVMTSAVKVSNARREAELRAIEERINKKMAQLQQAAGIEANSVSTETPAGVTGKPKYTEEQIRKMSVAEWVKAGRPT